MPTRTKISDNKSGTLISEGTKVESGKKSKTYSHDIPINQSKIVYGTYLTGTFPIKKWSTTMYKTSGNW